MCLIAFTDYLIQFGEGLGREARELEKVWEEVFGRYYRAVQNLVVDTLHESHNPVEKLTYAVRQMKTPESAKQAAKSIQKGYKKYSIEIQNTVMQLENNVVLLNISITSSFHIKI